jgi:hypothetical protein
MDHIALRWEAYASTLIPLGYKIIAEASLDLGEKTPADPEMIAVALAARTISNFKGALLMLHTGMIVEARVLLRCCYENLICVAAIGEEGASFVEYMRQDEQKSGRDRRELLLSASSAEIDEKDASEFRAYIEKVNALRPKPKLLSFKEASTKGAGVGAYTIYRQLSADSAHPSFHALSRYTTQTKAEDHNEYDVCISLSMDKKEGIQTIAWCCNAMLGVLTALTGILTVTTITPAVRERQDKFMSLFAETLESS